MLIFLFASILATTGIASAAVNDSDGDRIIDYLDPFPTQVEEKGDIWKVGDWMNFTFTSPTLSGYLYQEVVDIKTIEILDENGTIKGSQEFYIFNRTHPRAGLIQVYFLTDGWNTYKMDFANPNLLDITYVPSYDWGNNPYFEGKTWKYNLTQVQSNATIKKSVELTLNCAIGKETITVPAGTFGAFVIECKMSDPPTGNLVSNSKYWIYKNESINSVIVVKTESYNVTSGAPTETLSLNAASRPGIPKPTSPAPTPTKPAPGFELIAAAIGVTIAIYLCKRRS